MKWLCVFWQWIFSLFCLCVAIVYGLFTVTGLLGLVICVLALPVRPIRGLWKSILPKDAPRFSAAAILLAAFCVMLAAAPPKVANAPDMASQPNTTLVPVPTQAVSETVTEEPQATQAPVAASGTDPAVPSGTPASGADQTTAEEAETVYVASSGQGSRYHSDPNCSGMDESVALPRAEAEAQGYTPCKRCYG